MDFLSGSRRARASSSSSCRPFMTLGADVRSRRARRFFQLSSPGAQIVSIDNGNEIARLPGRDVDGRRVASTGCVGDKVEAAMRRKAVKGEALGRPPYGYRVEAKRRRNRRRRRRLRRPLHLPARPSRTAPGASRRHRPLPPQRRRTWPDVAAALRGAWSPSGATFCAGRACVRHRAPASAVRGLPATRR